MVRKGGEDNDGEMEKKQTERKIDKIEDGE